MDSQKGRGSAVAMITRALIPLVAPVLTYTCDELLDYAPPVIKGEAEDIFDFRYEPIPKTETVLDEKYMIAAREAFFEIVDRLKKEGQIKQTLELAIAAESERLDRLCRKDAEDWFVVSEISAGGDSEVATDSGLSGRLGTNVPDVGASPHRKRMLCASVVPGF